MKKKLIGYARVSSPSQKIDLQIQQLQEYAKKKGCEIDIFSEVRSAKEVRLTPSYFNIGILGNAINRAKEIDAPLVVTYLDRLSRNENNGMTIFNEVPIISVFERIDDTEDARAIFARAEAENKQRSNKTKNALAQVKANLKLDSIERYRNIYEEQGVPEFVAEYVWQEMINPKRHLNVAIWGESDIHPAIMMAWDDMCMGLDASIEEAADVAEKAIYNLSHLKRLRLAKELGYYDEIKQTNE